jgi:hypothetical protein
MHWILITFLIFAGVFFLFLVYGLAQAALDDYMAQEERLQFERERPYRKLIKGGNLYDPFPPHPGVSRFAGRGSHDESNEASEQ